MVLVDLFLSSKSVLLITTSQFLKDKKQIITQVKFSFIFLKIHTTAGKSHYNSDQQ